MLSDFAGCGAQYGYEGSLKEIYVLITGDFQAPSRMMSHICRSIEIILN